MSAPADLDPVALGDDARPARVSAFVDRDGVINRRIVDGYVRTWDEFEFLPGVLEAFAAMATLADDVVVVTNQQGVGKGLISPAALDDIHTRMREAVVAVGGRIDDVLVCSHLVSDACPCRKPSPGLISAWLAAHPRAAAGLHVMVGDAPSDMELARRWPVGTPRAVLVAGGPESADLAPCYQPDASVPSLFDFATRTLPGWLGVKAVQQ